MALILQGTAESACAMMQGACGCDSFAAAGSNNSSRRLLLTEAPYMTPNGKDLFGSISFFMCDVVHYDNTG